MTCTIETFRGHYVACSLPPISTNSLCYGSNTSGVHITRNDNTILQLLSSLASLFNIKKHTIVQQCDNAPIEVLLPCNVQIHKYQSNNLYVGHMIGNFWVKDGNGVYLRPELMINYRSNENLLSLERFTWKTPTRCTECDKYIDDYEYFIYEKPVYGERKTSPFQYICCLSCYDKLLPLKNFKVPVDRLIRQTLPKEEHLIHWKDNDTGEIYLNLSDRRIELNPDAYLKGASVDPNNEIDKAILSSAFAKAGNIDELVRELNEAQDYMLIDAEHLSRLAHVKGINIKNLGRVTLEASCNYVKNIALVLIISRGIKRLIQNALENAKDSREVIAKYLNNLLTMSGDIELWNQLTNYIQEHWGILIKRSILTKLHLPCLALATCQQLHIVIHNFFDLNFTFFAPFLKHNIIAIPSVLDEFYTARSLDLLLVMAHTLKGGEALKYYDKAIRIAAAIYHKNSLQYADIALEYGNKLKAYYFSNDKPSEYSALALYFFKDALKVYTKEEYAHKKVIECLLGLAELTEVNNVRVW